jgi:hypothetical protein
VSPFDSRNTLQKTVDQYVYVLQVACGEKNPIRRKAFETDVNYALQTLDPFERRYRDAFHYDLLAADGDVDVAMERVNAAIALLQQVGAGADLHRIDESPRLVLAESAMTFVDTLRALDAFDAAAVEILIEEALRSFDPETVPVVYDTALKTLVHRYVTEKIPETTVDGFAEDPAALAAYLKQL